MKLYFVLLFSIVLCAGCQDQNAESSNADNTPETTNVELVANVVEASCGQCQFGMEGSGCDLAVRIDGKSYYVDGGSIDDFGDAHGDDGLCNCIRQAKVTGEVKDGRYVATSFDVLPIDKKQQAAAKLDQLKKSRMGAAFAMSDAGLVVQDLWEEGVAGKAGLKQGDKIIKLNDKPIDEMNSDALRDILTNAESVNFSVQRGSEVLEVSISLAKD